MDVIKHVKQEILRLDPEAAVILFGSRSRGDQREDSDWDFLVLLDQPLDASLKALILERLYELELTSG
ncbi:MAG: nucleotidyltransferase domain-containing protein [Gammaproteobacteria bacterium]|nr:nucleotidyltransferase domain-containing protein [Gammaproteobacteria bacterium]